MEAPLIFIVVFWVVFYAYWIFSAFGAKRNARRGSWGFGLRIVILLAFIVLLQNTSAREFVIRERLIALDPALEWLGVVICACGLAFAIWARVYLGKNWGMPMSLKQDAQLVTTGPYQYVRHPIYTGMTLGMIGTALVVPWWIVPVVFAFGYFVYSAKVEEKIMTGEFGQKYTDYMKRSKMLIPFIF
jgi:protein-S-isoprenylcysteine O-methyltransferase Ste14